MSKKIVIIDGGIAGLSAGICSRLNGSDTGIIEMHTVTGGQCTAWERKDYRFDYCLQEQGKSLSMISGKRPMC